MELSPENRYGNSPLLAVTAVGFTLFVIAQAVLHQYTFVDDAFIFFRYVDNILAGNGPVFNVGERVEGFTSPLWLFLLTAVAAAGLDVAHAALFLGMGFAVITGLLVLYFPALRTPPLFRVLLAILLCVHPLFLFWVTSGMETFLYTCGLVATAFVFVREQQGERPHVVSGVLAGLTVLSRPEGMLLLLFGGLAAGSRRRAGYFLLGALPLPLLYQGFRLLYYGAFVSNSSMAKLGFSPGHLEMGLSYIARFWMAAPFALLCLLPLLFVMRSPAEALLAERGRLRAAYGFVLLHHVYFILIGGDFFVDFRFFVPLFPFLCLLAVWGLYLLYERLRCRHRAAAMGACVLLAAVLLFPAPDRRLITSIHGVPWIIAAGKLGVTLQRTMPETTRVAAPHIGALGYYSGLPLLDLLGLTDPDIAAQPIDESVYRDYPRRDAGHEKFDVAHSLSRKPDMIVLLKGVTSVPATHTSEIPRSFAMEHQLMGAVEADPVYRVTNIPVDRGVFWMALVRDDKQEQRP